MLQQGLPLVAKRAMDVVVSAALLVATSPVLLVASTAVAATMGRPVLFRQRRPGKDGCPFVLHKLRTKRMGQGSDAERLTALGRLLRNTSIDELPQLWDVLCGNMSLVGPRPLLMEYLDRYTPDQARRHEVLPGITGWAQVNGRNALTHEERFVLDVWYVDHWSLLLDMQILARTLKRVLTGSGIRARDHATMPVFTGRERET
jgi:lipopolysaccharide/colanic/teichoic acid biosynthesis glycosyltransferase